MKTITEFAAPTLKNAAQKKQELVTAGKTPEELPAALGEALKLDGDKLTYLLGALDAAGEKTNDLKRVLVAALHEGETAPSGTKLIGEKYYAVEYYPSIHKGGDKKDAGRDDDKRGGKHGNKRGGKRGDNRGGRGGDKRGEGRGFGGADRGTSPRPPRPAGAGTVIVKPLEKPVTRPGGVEAKPKQEG